MARFIFKCPSMLASFVALVVLGFFGPMAQAQEVPGATGPAMVKPSLQLEIGEATPRTWEQMAAAAAQESSLGPVTSQAKQFRPTISEQEYQQLKALAAEGYGSAQERTPTEAALAPQAAPVLQGVNFEGVDRNGAASDIGGGPVTFSAPDTHGAAGRSFLVSGQSHSYFVQVTNSHVNIYDVNTVTGARTQVKSVSLNSFFGYLKPTFANPQFCLSPRVIYDRVWNRWLICAAASPESPAMMRFFFAVSQTSNPTGPFYVYNTNVTFGVADRFWDFPQVGMDQDAVIFTGNWFVDSTGQFIDGRMITIAKAMIYNGRSGTVPMFSGLVGSVAPPLVLDQNRNTFLVSALPADNRVTLYNLNHSSRSAPTLTVSAISVPNYTVPPPAAQPGTAKKLDTLDSRFLNNSTQTGNRLFQVHTISALANNVAVPTPLFYEFDTATRTIAQHGLFFKSHTSHDFNATIAANSNRDVWVTWSATDPPSGVQAQVRFSGRRSTDPAGVIPAGSALAGSNTFYNPSAATVEPWGYYSAVALDPSNSLRAWIVNERIKTNTVWGSRIGRTGF